MPRRTLCVATLWARVVTPTDGVLLQCSSERASSPVAVPTDPSPARLIRARREGGVGSHSVMRILVRLLLILPVALIAPAAGAADLPPVAPAWVLPLAGGAVAEPYREPAHAYGPGHRGIDVSASGDTRVLAPTDGAIAFAGSVAGRGVLTIATTTGLVITLEPVDAVVTAGMPVSRGDVVGTLATGGHAAPGTVHIGVRRDGVYLDPSPWFAARERAVLLPCCDAAPASVPERRSRPADHVPIAVVGDAPELSGRHRVGVAVDRDL